ncbi:ankyrin repeat domain-containing protein [Brevibacillus choshinensis]|uniref:Ankyrin repeat domain-containing protein n=1 Tax=Brevibacillus choshinensis TaxID=54911 RepID=A0ABX7FK00_BRECH|nr:ankyrin repeat domain-containing protein [Brevibacillus choshinensis]QRG66452.1 ankyrin repeat domain-containing protein [Brevibacillus choshinensis]
MADQRLVQSFLEAASQGDVEALQNYVAQGVDLNARNKQKRTAILLAAMNDHYDAVAYLIEAGADIDLQDETCFNPFLYGCINGKLELVQLMVKAGTNVELLTRFGGVGITPASEKGHVEIVRELLNTTDINVNHTNFVGWTPLIEAIILNDGGERQQEVIRLLIEHGANVHMVDKYGVTPLTLARQKGYKEIEQILLEAGAK